MLTAQSLLLIFCLVPNVLGASRAWPLGASDIVWDGRVPSWFDLEDFDIASLSPFQAKNVKV